MAAYYTLVNMVNKLGMRFNEINQSPDSPFNFTVSYRTELLNEAQNKIIGLLERGLVAQLDSVALAKALTTGGRLDLTTVAISDRDGICISQKKVGAGNLTINGAFASAGTATLDVARYATIYSDANDSGNTYTITGTDINGTALTEAITGPSTTTVYGNKKFKTVTQVAIGASAVGNNEVGADSASIFEKHKGIDTIFHNGGIPCDLISFEEYKLYKAAEYTWTAADPIAYFFGDNVYIQPYTASDTCGIYYMREPRKMIYDENVPASSVACEFDAQISDIILDMATSIGFYIGNDPTRGAKYEADTINGIGGTLVKAEMK